MFVYLYTYTNYYSYVFTFVASLCDLWRWKFSCVRQGTCTYIFCIYIYNEMYIDMYVCLHMYLHIYIYMYVHTFGSWLLKSMEFEFFSRSSRYLYIYIYISIHDDMHINVYVCVHVYVHIYFYMYVLTFGSWLLESVASKLFFRVCPGIRTHVCIHN